MIVPALLSFSITVASYGLIKLSSILDPHEVFTPFVQKISFCAIGSPDKGLITPFEISLSISCALLIAASSVTEIKQLRPASFSLIWFR